MGTECLASTGDSLMYGIGLFLVMSIAGALLLHLSSKKKRSLVGSVISVFVAVSLFMPSSIAQAASVSECPPSAASAVKVSSSARPDVQSGVAVMGSPLFLNYDVLVNDMPTDGAHFLSGTLHLRVPTGGYEDDRSALPQAVYSPSTGMFYMLDDPNKPADATVSIRQSIITREGAYAVLSNDTLLFHPYPGSQPDDTGLYVPPFTGTASGIVYAVSDSTGATISNVYTPTISAQTCLIPGYTTLRALNSLSPSDRVLTISAYNDRLYDSGTQLDFLTVTTGYDNGDTTYTFEPKYTSLLDLDPTAPGAQTSYSNSGHGWRLEYTPSNILSSESNLKLVVTDASAFNQYVQAAQDGQTDLLATQNLVSTAGCSAAGEPLQILLRVEPYESAPY